MIKVPCRSRHLFDIRESHHGHFTIAHRRRRLWVPRLSWSALAFSVSYCEVITITAHNGIRLLPWVPAGEPLVGPRMEDGRFREPVFRHRQRPEGGCM